MAKAKSPARIEPTPVTSFDLLCQRVKAQVDRTPGTDEKHTRVERLGAYEADWERLLGQIEETDHVTVARRDDGSVDLFWKVPRDD